MLLTIFSNYVILISIFGFSLVLKKILVKESNLRIENIDLLYGFLFIIFLSLLLNFIVPLKYFTIPIIIIGIFFYFFGLKNRNYKINFFFYFLIIFFITFISYYGKDNVDSPMYHLQIIKWISLHKINFGISNLEIRLVNNSSWHSFIGLMNLTLLNFSSKYFLSAIILSFIVYEGLNFKKNIKYSNIFLYLIICYLFVYSYLHPFANGVILNQLGNPERDVVSMLVYFSTIYLFLKIFEENNNLRYQNNLINIFIISAFICVTIRVTTIPILFLVLYIFYRFKDYKILSLSNIFISFVGLLWILRSFILSGCLIFPVKQTCIKTSWSADINIVEFYVTEAMRLARSLPTNFKMHDLDFTLYSYDWLLPWFKNYFLTTAILQINSIIIIFIILFHLFKYFLIKKRKGLFFKISEYEIVTFLVLIFHFFFWMQAPDTRYGFGMHLVIPCFFIVIFIKNNLEKIIQKLNRKITSLVFLSIFSLFFLKNLSFFSFKDFLLTQNRNYDFSLIEKIGTYNGIVFYYNNWKCADFKGVCVNSIKPNYDISKKYSYTFFK